MQGLKVTIHSTDEVNKGGVYNDLSVDGKNRPRFAPTDATKTTHGWTSLEDSCKTKSNELATHAFRRNAYGDRCVDASDAHGDEAFASVDDAEFASAPALHSESSILEIIEAHSVSLGKNFFDTKSREFELGVEPKWVNRSNISKEEAEALDLHPDYTDVTFDFRDVENAKKIMEQMQLFQDALKSGTVSPDILEKMLLLSRRLGGVDLGALIASKTQLTDEQLYRSGVKAHRVLKDIDGKPVVAVQNFRNNSVEYHYSNGQEIKAGKYSTIKLTPNLWIARPDGKIAQSPYALHRHEFNQYFDLELPSEKDKRNWERMPLNYHTQQRWQASLQADFVFNQLSSDKAKSYFVPRTREEIEADERAKKAAEEEAERIAAMTEQQRIEEENARLAAAKEEHTRKLKLFAPKFREPETEKEIKNLMSLGKKVFMVSSSEWERVYSAIRNVGAEKAQDVLVYDPSKGIRKFGETEMEEGPPARSFAEAAGHFERSTESIILVVNNFDEGSEITSKPNLAIIQQLFRDYNYGENSSVEKSMILCSQTKYVPSELSEELSTIDVKLPDKNVLRGVAERAIGAMSRGHDIEPLIHDKTIEAALGLTTMQAEEAFKKALLERGKLGDSEIDFVIKQKEAIINRSGVLECMHPKINLNDVGGLDTFKEWIHDTKAALDPEAREFGIKSPNGALLIGVPGTGKSLLAKAIGSEWKLPLIKLDMSKIMGSFVGESEKKMQHALNVVSSMAPCVFLIDELEKALAGLESSGRSDGGTTARVVGNVLTFMQDNETDVFTIATANDISKLPPELMRKGRFDEIFFVDLPSTTERIEILKIHTNKIKAEYKADDLSLEEVVSTMNGFTGAEIEGAVAEGMKKAFRSPDRKLTNSHLLHAAQTTKPSIVTQKEKIAALREYAKDRFRFASSNNEQENGGIQQ